jgi:hypothetical protein
VGTASHSEHREQVGHCGVNAVFVRKFPPQAECTRRSFNGSVAQTVSRANTRDELRRQPLWSVCVDRAHDFVFRHNVRLLAAYPVGIAAVVACAAVILITIYQQPDTTRFAVESSPVPSTPPGNAEREFNLTPPAMARTFNAERILLPRSRDILLLPSDPRRSDEFVPLKLDWESPDD